MKSKMVPNNPNSSRRRRTGLPFAVPRYILRTLIGVILSLQALIVAGQSSVSGKITDELGEPIPGVNVVVKGTTTGTGTDLQGRYSLNINGEADVLIISAVGFDTQEIGVGQRTLIDIQLKANLTELEEVVVTGYSTMMKKDISSSIAVVDVDDMKKIAASNIGDQLQGKVAGVQVATTGDPGSFQYVRIRGLGTINNNEPLYVIDGVPVQNETDMNFLNPYDIESIQVLKDAASASIYGARASNGVIVVTTRRGRGKSNLNFEFFTGIQQPSNLPEVANSAELLEIYKGLYAGANRAFDNQFYVEESPGNWVLPDFLVNQYGYREGDPEVDPSRYVLNTTDPSLFGKNHPIAPANKQGTDWFEELFKPAPITSLQLSASSGNEKGSHYVSFNYFDYHGTLIEDKYRRFQTRLNSDFAVANKFRIGENINIAIQNREGNQYFDGYDIRKAYYNPTVSVYDINGYWATSTTLANPVADQHRWAEGTKGTSLRLTGSAYGEFDLTKDLTFKTTFGLDYFLRPTTFYWPACPECSRPGTDNLSKDWSTRRNWVLSSVLNYQRRFSDHAINALAGIEARDAYFEGLSASGSGLAYGYDPSYRELQNTQGDTYSISSSRSNNRMLSAFFNANYSFADKYILSATVRSDGSSRFVKNKFGVFPGFSAGWRINKESFLEDSNIISSLMLRASWGITGNNEVVGGDYPGYSPYGTSIKTSSYPINGNLYSVMQGFALLYYGNPELRWEKSKLTNIAFDATLLKNIDVTVEWYSRLTEDMIYGVAPPLQSGISRLTNTNIGSMSNKGLDLKIGYRGKAFSNSLDYNVTVIGTHYSNKVLALADSASFIGDATFVVRTAPGYPMSQLYGFVADGLWQSQEQIDAELFADIGDAKPGRMKFKDINADGEIDNSDRTFIGNPIPKFILGLNVAFYYKSFDLTAYVSGVFGKEAYNLIRGSTEFYQKPEYGVGLTLSKEILYEAGKTLPVLDLNDGYSGKNSSYWVEDASFLRLRNIVLGYSLPPKTVSKLGLTKLRLYLQGQNLVTFTKYSGLDPDVNLRDMQQGNVPGRDLVTGVDYGHYPTSRQFIIGFNIQF